MSLRELRDAFALKVNQRFFYGWVIVGVSALGMFSSGPGQSHIFSVFIGPIGRDLDISSTGITSAYALATLIAAGGLLYMGRLIDRFGPRRMLFVVAFLLGVACLGFGAASNVIWLALGFAALRFLGQGSIMLNCSNMTSQWFSRRRGFALSLMALGYSASMAAHPPLAQWLVEVVGWREAWIWLGAITWVLLLPVVVVFVHNRPEDLGLRPDGALPRGPGVDHAGVASHLADVGLTLRQAVRTSAFYIIAAGLFALSMLLTALNFFQISIFVAQGLSAQVAAQVFSVSAATVVLTMPVAGRMLDRYRTEQIFAGTLVIMAASLVAVTLVRDIPTALLYGVVFGLNNAVSLTLYAYLWPRYFGRRHLGSIQGAGQMIGVVGASFGPLPLGIAFDLFGSFTGTLLVLALLPLACAGLALTLRAPQLMSADESAKPK